MDLLSQLKSVLASRYRIDREIGSGGMATVYLAQDLRHHRKVALKVLKPELAAVLGTERFLTEISVTANLQHPHLLPLFDSGEVDGLFYYVMPFIDGETLRARLQREGQLPIDEALRITTAVASALDYAHRNGVIHRDLKPENILLQEGQPFVSDFGIAFAISAAGGERVTQTGLSLGTPEYMSPEQATGSGNVDGRSDIYSLGAVLYEMLAGEPPHTGPTVQAVIARLLTDKPRSLHSVRVTVSPALDAVVLRALAKLPADRYQTAGAMSAALTQPEARPLPVHTRRNLVVIGAMALAAIVVALALRADDFATEPYTNMFELELPDSFGWSSFAGIPGVPQSNRSVLAVSPNGAVLAFVGSDADGVGLFLRDMSQLQPRRLPHEGWPGSLSFSPSGEWLAYIDQSAIKKVRTDGSAPPVTVADSGWYHVTWSVRNELVASKMQSLWVLSPDGARRRLVANPYDVEGHWSYSQPHVLPSGRHALIAIGMRGQPELGVVTLRNGEVVPLGISGSSPRYVEPGYLLFRSSTNVLTAVPFSARTRAIRGPARAVISASSDEGAEFADFTTGADMLVYYPISRARKVIVLSDLHGAQRPLISQPDYFSSLRVSPDGKRIAFVIDRGDSSHIWTYDMPSGPLVRLTHSGWRNDHPEWTEDGREILYTTSRKRGDPFELWALPSNGTGKGRPILQLKDTSIARAEITRNGRILFFATGPFRNAALWYKHLQGDTTRHQILNNDNQPEFNRYFLDGKLSPAGELLAYQFRGSTYVASFPTLEPQERIGRGGRNVIWSRDGRHVFHGDSGGIAMVELDTVGGINVRSRTLLPITAAPMMGAGFDVLPDGSLVVTQLTKRHDRVLVIQGLSRALKERF